MIFVLDDHQSIIDRLKFLSSFGVKHLIYEDNYPISQGDCLSPKKVLGKVDYIIDRGGLRELIEYEKDLYLTFCNHVSEYIELPPLFRKEKTRWGDFWEDDSYPTPEPLVKNEQSKKYPLFFQEALDYTWICYLGLK